MMEASPASVVCWVARLEEKRGVAMKVGFIGLGIWALVWRRTCLKAGHDVTVYNRTRTKVEAFVAQEPKAAASVSDACSAMP